MREKEGPWRDAQAQRRQKGVALVVGVGDEDDCAGSVGDADGGSGVVGLCADAGLDGGGEGCGGREGGVGLGAGDSGEGHVEVRLAEVEDGRRVRGGLEGDNAQVGGERDVDAVGLGRVAGVDIDEAHDGEERLDGRRRRLGS